MGMMNCPFSFGAMMNILLPDSEIYVPKGLKVKIGSCELCLIYVRIHGCNGLNGLPCGVRDDDLRCSQPLGLDYPG